MSSTRTRDKENNNKKQQQQPQPGMLQLGNYELGRTLGEGNFAKVKLAKNLHSGHPFAVKILDKAKIIQLNITDQIKREIATLKLLKHPNVVRLHEASKGKLSESQGRKLFQQLIDGVSYCHGKGVYHRDLKLENVLIDAKGNIKISDFGLSALPQHIREIFKGDAQIPKWLSSGARNMIRRILDPNPDTRITIAGIEDDEWFKQDYTPAVADDEEEDLYIDDEAFSMDEVASDGTRRPESPTIINAFQLIGMSSCLDLSGFFEEEDVSERKIRFTSNHSAKDLLARIQDIVTEMGFRVQMKNGRLKATQEHRGQKCHGSLSVAAEVFEISPSLYVVELRKSCGDSTVYRQLCKKLSNDLGVRQGQGLVYTQA
ncbi:CBL-interacting serine/threonine-protein kinase 1 isoform 3 [Theobroma cacao]|uniref:non-specific serine/threonine protein kinase n=1 Tax=Theobroma cacao TaxID=3641 RepID=A0A061ERB5_THECC|nr:CBL-interacting serine/threonine-protein kinase 1 isoform 3 [Theobroma cacao]